MLIGVTALMVGTALPLAAETYTATSYAQDGLVGQRNGLENSGVGFYDATTNDWADLTGNSGDFAVFTGVAPFMANDLIEAAMKCSDSFLVGRVIPNAHPALSLLRSSLRSGDIRRLGDKPPYHCSHNISLPEQ